MISLKISALDSWFFRDGRNFEEVGGLPIFTELLPSQRTLYGAIRARLYEVCNENEQALLIGDDNDDTVPVFRIGHLTLQAPDGTHYVPLPDDQICYEDEYGGIKVSAVNLGEKNKILTDLSSKKSNIRLPELPELSPGHSPIKMVSPWVRIDEFEENWHTGNSWQAQQRSTSIIDFASVVKKETRIGIARKDKMVVEGQLYQTQHLRLDGWVLNVRLFAVCENNSVANKAKKAVRLLKNQLQHFPVQRFGADGRGAVVQAFESYRDVKRIETNNTAVTYAIALLSPAALPNQYGFLGNERQGPCQFDVTDVSTGKTVTLIANQVSAICDRPVFDKGWSMKQKAPRPTRQLTPTGSVYYIEFASAKEAKDALSVISNMTNPAIGDLTHFGYGQISIKAIEEVNEK